MSCYRLIEAQRTSFPTPADDDVQNARGLKKRGYYDWKDRPPSRRRGPKKKMPPLPGLTGSGFMRSTSAPERESFTARRYGSPRVHAAELRDPSASALLQEAGGEANGAKKKVYEDAYFRRLRIRGPRKRRTTHRNKQPDAIPPPRTWGPPGVSSLPPRGAKQALHGAHIT